MLVKVNLIKNLVFKNKYIYIYTHTYLFLRVGKVRFYPQCHYFYLNIYFSEILWTVFVIYLDSCFIPFRILAYILNLF